LGDITIINCERITVVKDDKDYNLLLKKTETVEKEMSHLKSETTFLRKKLNEQSDIILQLIKIVKELEK